MSRADELLAQYETKINQVGQWIAIRHYSGTTVKTYSDVLTRAYIRYEPITEFVGAVIQNHAVVYALVGMLRDAMPGIEDNRLVTTNDRLVTGFWGFGDATTPPALSEESHVSGGKETAINSVIKKAPEGRMIALEIHAVG